MLSPAGGPTALVQAKLFGPRWLKRCRKKLSRREARGVLNSGSTGLGHTSKLRGDRDLSVGNNLASIAPVVSTRRAPKVGLLPTSPNGTRRWYSWSTLKRQEKGFGGPGRPTVARAAFSDWAGHLIFSIPKRVRGPVDGPNARVQAHDFRPR